MAKAKIVCVVGTRPDTIKTAPVITELNKFSDHVETLLISTGQHKEMFDQSLSAFGLHCHHNLQIMQHGQTLAEVTTRALQGLAEFYSQAKPDFVMAQGDTTTTFAAGLAAFYQNIPFGHIEAGLRTESVRYPFPEEFNRRAVGMFASQNYAPTDWAAANLQEERVDQETIFVTGNTGIDAVQYIAKSNAKVWFPNETRKILLLTTHRRENWLQPQRNIARGILQILNEFPNTLLVVAAHPNPTVRRILNEEFADHSRVYMIEPPDYPDFVKLMQRSYLIFTDSGGVQEEAPTFGVPVLVLRECTERPEGILAGKAVLVGTNQEIIYQTAHELFKNESTYNKMSQAMSPYGDGNAAPRIRHLTLKYLGIESPKEYMWESSKQLS